MNKKFTQIGLSFFQYKNTAWFQAIDKDDEKYKTRLLIDALALAICIPIFDLIVDLHLHDYGHIPAYIASSAFLTSLLVSIRVSRSTALASLITLSLALPGFLLLMYFPTGRAFFLLIVGAYPFLAFQLSGTKRGSMWCGGFYLAIAVTYVAQALDFIPEWRQKITYLDIAILLVSGGIASAYACCGERRHEKLINQLTDMLIYEEPTHLPNKEVLVNSFSCDRPNLLAIVKIENFSDLVALFGYDFSDTISGFVSRTLLGFQERFRYVTYQLKYNELALLIETDRVLAITEAAQLLSEIMQTVDLSTLPWEGDHVQLNYRVGGAIVDPADSRNPLSLADIALKRAERGHSVITIYDGAEPQTTYPNQTRFSDLVANRENGTFKTIFQPIFSRDGARIEWYEALLRLKNEAGEYVSIYEYLDIARSTGFYQHLTDFVLRSAAEAICEHDVDVSVNISIHDIARNEFIQLVDETFDRIRDKQGRIIFEILESDELVELDKCLWFINYIARYGFKIAIDDFGTGYSNYSTLISLPIDIVKIDGSLIKRIHHDANAKLLVEGIVHFCVNANKKTVAEFVADQKTFDTLKTMDVDYLQGFYLSQPAPIAQCPCPALSPN